MCNIKEPEETASSNIEGSEESSGTREFEGSGIEEFERSSIEKFEGSSTKESKDELNVVKNRKLQRLILLGENIILSLLRRKIRVQLRVITRRILQIRVIVSYKLFI
ncbi:hypothetical protein RhiirA4_423753 [Rhizophagus irregularis]|uniref:Uncharacterized protein n=1 Tax=Rhizophagus irregularis TaxID=588596 RepID=A0A2I1GUY2_9GLOM|nr:hypothetical protein RhiirA4_423753 [Rhizophagus irregularis]